MASFKIIPSRIKQARLSRGYSTADIAELLDISKQAVSQYELGKLTPSDAILLQLASVLDYPVAFFRKDLPSINASKSPVFFRSRKTATSKAKLAAKVKIDIYKEIIDYFGKYLDFPAVNLPKIEYERDYNGLSDEQIEEYAVYLRKFWKLGNGPIPNLMNVIQENGIMVSVMKIGHNKVDALSLWNDGTPYIFVSGDKESNANLRFSIAHELGHLLLHADYFTDEELDKKVIDEQLESEANKFAAAFLMPADTFSPDICSSSIDYFIQLKMKWLSAVSSMIYRCDDLNLLTENQIRYLKSQMTKRRYWHKEPLDDKIAIEKPFACRQAVDLLLENNIVSKNDIVSTIGCNALEIEQYCFLEPGTLKEKTPSNIISIRPGIR